MSTFLEGVDVIDQPCTIAVLVPALAIVLAARRRGLASIVGFGIGVSLLMWARAGVYWTIPADGPIVVLIGALVLAGFAVAVRPALVERVVADRSGAAFGAGVIVGAVSGWLWRPCVGLELGDIFNNAATDGPQTLALMAIYVAGVLLPAIVLAVAPYAWPAAQRVISHRVPAVAGAAIGVVYAVAVFAGRYDDLLSELLRRSSI